MHCDYLTDRWESSWWTELCNIRLFSVIEMSPTTNIKCRIWVIAALKAIRTDGQVVGTYVLYNIEGPGGIIKRAKVFVSGRIQNQRYPAGRDAMEPRPLLDMLTGEEAYPSGSFPEHAYSWRGPGEE